MCNEIDLPIRKVKSFHLNLFEDIFFYSLFLIQFGESTLGICSIIETIYQGRWKKTRKKSIQSNWSVAFTANGLLIITFSPSNLTIAQSGNLQSIGFRKMVGRLFFAIRLLVELVREIRFFFVRLHIIRFIVCQLLIGQCEIYFPIRNGRNRRNSAGVFGFLFQNFT